MKSEITRTDNGSVIITIHIPWIDVQKNYEEVVNDQVKNAEISGFRKGKAPRAMVESNLDKTKVFEEVIKRLLPTVYGNAVTEHGLHPIIIPKIELIKAKEKEDWEIKAETCETPDIDLGLYKDAIGEVKKAKSKKIWTPKDADTKIDEKDLKPTLDDLLGALLSAVTVKIPTLLIEHEVNRYLSDLIDQVKKLGLTIDQYLTSTHKTSESVREEFTKQAVRTLSLEFALEKIADTEHISVTDGDIDTAINTAKSDEEKEALKKERYYLASVIRRQKTLDYLANT